MKKSIILPILTLLVSGIAFFLRKQQISQAKDPITLLFTPGAKETQLLVGLLLGFMLCLALFLLSGGRPLPNYIYTVYCPHPLFLGTVGLGSLVLILSILVGMMDIKGQYDQHILEQVSFRFPLLFFVGNIVVALVGVVMLYLGWMAYQGIHLEECWLTVIPAYLAVIRMLGEYRTYAILPHIQDKAYPIFGTIFICLSLYHLSATAYVNPRPRLIIFFSLSSVVLTGVILASGVSVYEGTVYLGLNLYMLAFAGAILQNTYISRAEYRTPPPPSQQVPRFPQLGEQ